MKIRFLSLFSLLALLSMVLMPSLAAGPVYGELPDLGGQEIRIAVENLYPPFQFENPSTGETMGYEYDMVAEICARINCTPVYEVTSFDVQIASVGEGQYDMGMNGLSIREDREEIVDFSTSYITLQQYLLVREDEDRFTTYAEFVENGDLILGVQQGTSGFFITGDVPDDRKVVFNEFGATIAALVAGDIDALPVDATAAAGFINTTGQAVRITGDPVSSDNFGLIFPNDSELVAPVSAAIDSMIADGFLDFPVLQVVH